jgi:predicted anti-sigma-YlaC factor YlaD
MMASLGSGDADCRRTRVLLDVFLSNELAAGPATRVAGHLAECAVCWSRFYVREQIKERLHTAVTRSEAPCAFKRKVSRMLHRLAVSELRSFSSELE